MSATSPLGPNTDLVMFTVTANGAVLPDTVQVQHLRVHKQINRIASARLTLYDGNASGEAFTISSSNLLLPGTAIVITAGYHNTAEQTLFKGIVVKHGVRVKSDGSSFLVLTCYDEALKLTIGRKSAYAGTSDSDVFSALIGAAGLVADVEATSATSEEIVRYYATDWDFIVARAEVNGQIVLVDDGTVSVQAPKTGGDAALVVAFGDALYELDAEIDAALQLPSVSASSWDYTTQAAVSGNSSEPSVNAQGNLTGQTLAQVLASGVFGLQATAPASTAELTQWASAQLLKSRLAKIRGKFSFRGNASPKPGALIELAGVGDRFDGDGFMSSVTHTIDGGNWRTEVGLGLSPQWFVEEAGNVEAPLASGLIPGVAGLLLGTVKQIDQDPIGQNRILVEVPMINPEGDAVWARLASGYATDKAGIFFIPELGDEVVLGFVNGDPRAPVILGSLYSSKHTPPFAPDAPNTNKAIVTRNQLKMTLDDVNKVIVISTPGGQTITLSDAASSITLVDSNQNKISMSASGITIDSCAAISLTAKTDIKLDASAGMTLSAGTQMKASAASVDVSADTALSLAGSASAKLTSSGELVIQGAMVMIN